jgi:hypothetical protein
VKKRRLKGGGRQNCLPHIAASRKLVKETPASGRDMRNRLPHRKNRLLTRAALLQVVAAREDTDG